MDAQSLVSIELPCSKESEMIVLGSMLINERYLKHALSVLEEADFYFKEHQVIFTGIKLLHNQNTPIDLFLVQDHLKGQNISHSTSITSYLTALSQYIDPAAQIESHIDDLKKYSELRQLIHLAHKMTKSALELSLDKKEDLIRTIFSGDL